MERRKPGVDVILDLLLQAKVVYDRTPFVASLLLQYQERGFLTRKQLEGLYAKAAKIKDVNTGKLATLEAIIKKMPARYKSEAPVNTAPLHEKNIPVQIIISAILEKYPAHKRVLYFKTRHDTHHPLSPAEISELARFHQLLIVDKKT